MQGWFSALRWWSHRTVLWHVMRADDGPHAAALRVAQLTRYLQGEWESMADPGLCRAHLRELEAGATMLCYASEWYSLTFKDDAPGPWQLFWIRHYYPGGGATDLVGMYPNEAAAREAMANPGGLSTPGAWYADEAASVGGDDGHWQLFNLATGEVKEVFPS